MDAYETSIYTAVIATAVLLGIVILIFTWSIVRTQKRYFESRNGQLLAEIRLQEEERSRIGHDLHDELGPVLAMTRLRIERLASREPHLADELGPIAESIDRVLRRMGGIARSLTPGSLLQKGLKAVLDDFFELCRQAHTLPLFFRYEVKGNIRPEVGLHLFRMVQEIVYNAIKHSGADFIRVELVEKKGKVFLVCEDNGKGYEGDSGSGKGLGVDSLKDRVLLLGGRMHVISGEGKGTTYFFEIPLKNSHGAY